MQCPNCQSLNPDDAKWCGLCLTKFGEAQPPQAPQAPQKHEGYQVDPPQSLMPRVNLPDDLQSERAWQSVADPLSDMPPQAPDGPVGTVQGQSVWVCPQCSGVNDMQLNSCAACGTSFFDRFVQPEDREHQPRKDPRTAAALSLIPGVGHFYLSQTAQGLPRLFLGIWWGATALTIAGGNPVLFSIKILYLLATLSLIVMSAIDAYREADQPGTPPILTPRFMFYIAMGLLALLIFGGIAAAMAFRR